MFEVIFYKDEKGYSPVNEYLSSLPKKQQDKIIAYVDRLAQFGFNLKRPTADSLLEAGLAYMSLGRIGIGFCIAFIGGRRSYCCTPS